MLTIKKKKKKMMILFMQYYFGRNCYTRYMLWDMWR